MKTIETLLVVIINRRLYSGLILFSKNIHRYKTIKTYSYIKISTRPTDNRGGYRTCILRLKIKNKTLELV